MQTLYRNQEFQQCVSSNSHNAKRPVLHQLARQLGKDTINIISDLIFSAILRSLCMYSNQSIMSQWHAIQECVWFSVYGEYISYMRCREEGFGHIITIELLPQQKFAVTNEIRTLCRLISH